MCRPFTCAAHQAINDFTGGNLVAVVASRERAAKVLTEANEGKQVDIKEATLIQRLGTAEPPAEVVVFLRRRVVVRRVNLPFLRFRLAGINGGHRHAR